MQNFIKKIKLKAHLKTTELFKKIIWTYLSQNSTSNQTFLRAHPTVKTFFEVFQFRLRKEERRKNALPDSNLTRKEIESLKGLHVRDNNIIIKSDKGGALVIQ